MREKFKMKLNKRQMAIGKHHKAVLMLFLLMSFLIVNSFVSEAAIKEKEGKKETIQRTPTNTFDLQRNTVSNFQFPVTNYGILFLDVAQNRGGGYWPRGSLNQYLFGGGVWFAAQKWIWTDTGTVEEPKKYRKLTKLVELTYNPSSGSSWMVPGRIEDQIDEVDNTDIFKYRCYFSTDFRTSDGSPINPADGPNWPIWDASTNEKDVLKQDRYFGYYLNDVGKRNLATNKRGPAFISGEDIFATFKDTDLNYYEGGVEYRQNLGYPLRLQFEQYIYSWGFGDYKDFIFIRFEMINKSTDTLFNCFLAPVMDVDIARSPNTTAGAGNDFAKYYDVDPSLNLAVQWTRDDRGEKGNGFGYLGFDFLESPSVYHRDRLVDTVIDGKSVQIAYMCVSKDTVDGKEVCLMEIPFDPGLENFPRKDRKWYENEYQLGLKTFRRWPINDDISEDESRYNYLSSPVIDQGEGEAGDYRFLMSTGSFNMLPGDTVRTVVGMILANSLLADADGSTEDLVELVRKDKFAQQVYDNNFQAPIPPDKSIIYRWDPLNHAVAIQWDSTSEITNDKYERGLDFMGFRLYRARRNDIDTFDVNEVSPTIQYTSGKGPLGWKQVAQWEIQSPFYKSVRRAGGNQEDLNMPFIDSLIIAGPEYKRDAEGNLLKDQGGNLILDTFAVKVMRKARGVMHYPDYIVYGTVQPFDSYLANNGKQKSWNHPGYLLPVIMGVDSLAGTAPWGKYFYENCQNTIFPIWYNPYDPNDPQNKQFLLEHVLVGTVRLNQAYLDYNPLYWVRVTVEVDPSDTVDFPNGMDTTTKIKYLKDTYRTILTNNNQIQLVMDQLRPVVMDSAMKFPDLIYNAIDSLYLYIQNGKAKVEFPDFEGRIEVREKLIVDYMKEITGGNRFIDIGDDNRSGEISFNLNPTKTEKLINNVPYYYKLLAYDEGDYSQPTPRKLNAAFEGLPNVKKTYPREASVMKTPEFKIVYVDSARIGGLYDFKFYGLDNDRVRQLFSGHTLELEFTPSWFSSNFQLKKENVADPVTIPYSMYRSLMTIRDKSDNDRLLFQQETFLEQTSGSAYIRNGYTENAQSWVVDYEAIHDSVGGRLIRTAEITNDTVLVRSSEITTGDFKSPGYYYTYGFLPPAYGTIGFSFNYTALQMGGIYRPDSASIYPPVKGSGPIIKGDLKIPIQFTSTVTKPLNDYYSTDLLRRTELIDTIPTELGWGWDDINEDGRFSLDEKEKIIPYFGRSHYGSFNNGPADYLVEFKAGGQETIRLKTDFIPEGKDFVCNYLLVDVKNQIKYKRPSLKGDSVIVNYPLPVEHLNIPITPNYPYPEVITLGANSNDFIGKYNMYTTGWINTPKSTEFNRKNAIPVQLVKDIDYTTGKRVSIGTQGRFYFNAISTDGMDTLYVVNVFQGSGCSFAFDLARFERINGGNRHWTLDTNTKKMELVMPKPGDQVLLKTNGGALGFPMPGAKVQIYIDSNYVREGQFTDDLLEQIGVVPNPYYITHEGQASPYDAKIYFTRLPKRATIDIYTLTGDLVRTLEHDEYKSPERDKIGADVWDLLTKNRQRVQSQSFVAIIKTPDGAQTVKKFSVVVGGFRLVPEDD